MKPLELGAELLAPDNDTADGLGDSYVQRFGEHAEWNDLYKVRTRVCMCERARARKFVCVKCVCVCMRCLCVGGLCVST